MIIRNNFSKQHFFTEYNSLFYTPTRNYLQYQYTEKNYNNINDYKNDRMDLDNEGKYIKQLIYNLNNPYDDCTSDYNNKNLICLLKTKCDILESKTIKFLEELNKFNSTPISEEELAENIDIFNQPREFPFSFRESGTNALETNIKNMMINIKKILVNNDEFDFNRNNEYGNPVIDVIKEGLMRKATDGLTTTNNSNLLFFSQILIYLLLKNISEIHYINFSVNIVNNYSTYNYNINLDELKKTGKNSLQHNAEKFFQDAKTFIPNKLKGRRIQNQIHLYFIEGSINIYTQNGEVTNNLKYRKVYRKDKNYDLINIIPNYSIKDFINYIKQNSNLYLDLIKIPDNLINIIPEKEAKKIILDNINEIKKNNELLLQAIPNFFNCVIEIIDSHNDVTEYKPQTGNYVRPDRIYYRYKEDSKYYDISFKFSNIVEDLVSF